MKIFLSILVVRTAAIVVSNAKTLRNPWLNDACFFFFFSFGNNISRVMILFNTVHQYKMGTTNTDFKMFGVQTNFGISRVRTFYTQIIYVLTG